MATEESPYTEESTEKGPRKGLSRETEERSSTSTREELGAETRSESSGIDTSGYEGNPVQFGRPAGNPPRYILIAAETEPSSVGNSRIIVNRFVNEATQPASGITAAGYDVVTMVTDVSFTNIANLVTQTSTHIVVTYNNSALPDQATPRTIRVTWQSGFVKEFVILLPGKWANNNNPLVFGSLAPIPLDSDTYTTNCNPDNEVQTYRNVGTYGPWAQLISSNYLEIFASRVVLNPYSGTMLDTLPEGQWVFANGANFSGSIIDQTFQLTSAGGGTLNHFNLSHRQYFGMPQIANMNPASPAWWGQTNPARLGEPVPGPDEHEYHVIKLSYPYASNYDNQLPWTGSTDQSGNLVNFGFASTIHSDQYLLEFWNGLQGYGMFMGYDSIYGGDGDGYSFRSYIMYSSNIPNCEREPRPVIDACADPNSMAYYQYTGNDCDGTSIPASVLLDPTTAIFAPQSCCPSCINSNGDDISYSTQPLTLNVQGSNPTTPGGTNGWINVTIKDGGFGSNTLLGATFGLPTGNANYTFVLQSQDATYQMQGNTAGHAVGSGAISSNSFTFGNGLTAADNTNNGLLQGGVGNSTYATSSAQGYVPAAQGTTNSAGLKAGLYNVFVFDSSSTVCLAQVIGVQLKDPLPIVGCTDSNALNYDSNATIANNVTCHYCDDTTGQLVDGNSTPNVVAPIAQALNNPFTITYPTNSTDTGSEIQIVGIQASVQFQAYINNIVSGTTQNADYKVELYKWDSQTASGNSAFGTLAGFNANTTQVGSTITSVGSAGWNVLLNAATLGAGFAYGYYSIKVYVDDPDATVEQEQCYEIFDITIPVPACQDPFLTNAGVTSDGVLISDSNLWFQDQTICDLNNNYCCDTPTFTPVANFDPCTNFTYESSISCFPPAEVLVYQIQYYDSGNWINVGPPTSIGSLGQGIVSPFVATIAEQTFQTNGNGDYRIEWVSSYSAAPDCTVTTPTVSINLPIYGCTDPSALNYDAAAICDDTCLYCVYGCMDPSASNYDPNATCDDGTCYTDVYGCTDPTATNYDPNATIDDGSCVHTPCGCTDPTAINYGYSGPISNNNYVGNPPACDDGSCIVCDDPAMTVSYTTTAATSYVVASGTGYYCGTNNDGCVQLTVTSSTCNTGQWELVTCTTFCGLSQSTTNWIPPGNYDFNTAIEFCNLPAGTLTFTILDCHGCELIFDVLIPSSGTSCGCTDPAADNYNPSALYDDGSCEYCGCTDENATNYNPSATQECVPGICEYGSGGSACQPHPCIPTGIDQTIRRIEVCIAENGFDYYNKLVTGQADDCSIMNVWKLILMGYLLKKIGLDCLYNCEDSNTPSPSSAYRSCEDLWIEGGPSTGLNDSNVNTLTPAVGTTSTVSLFDPSGTGELTPGDIIKHHISGNIWFFQGPAQSGLPTPVSVAGLDPENASGNISGYWAYCNDNMRYISNSNNINYIDNFINFANKFCRDCGNDPQLLTGSSSNQIIPDIQQGIDGIDDLEI
tara:strand:- start:5830 stop:10299 length:4470 start_codon:yes stop_codon:yes gene_type:complete